MSVVQQPQHPQHSQHQHAPQKAKSPLAEAHEISDDEDDIDDDQESHDCRRCDLPISEGHAYELGGDRWHMYCFSCSKCSKLLGTSSNFLVLGTGDLICSDCSYACNACGKKIDDLAILTGDQAYCSSCFCCRNCKKRIEDLRYARTSKGLFCMSCHEKLLEKKKRHEQEKKLKQQQQQQSLFQNQNSSSNTLNRSSKMFGTVADKSLPKIPGQSSSSSSPINPNSAETTTSTYFDYNTSKDSSVPQRITSPDSFVSDLSTPGVIESHDTNTITTVLKSSPKISVQDDVGVPIRSPRRAGAVLETNTPKLEPAVGVSPTKTSPFLKETYTSPFMKGEENHDLIDNLNISTPQKIPPVSPLRSNLMKTPNGDVNRKAHVVDSMSSSSSANNILSSYINNESPPPKISPPKAPDDFIDLNDSTDELDEFGEKKNNKKEVFVEAEIDKYIEKPIGFGDYRKNQNIPSGLNIQGLDAQEDDSKASFDSVRVSIDDSSNDFIKTPNDKNISSWKFGSNKILSPISPSPKKRFNNNAVLESDNNNNNQNTGSNNNNFLSRSKSIRSPKNFFRSSKHKKTESASSIENYKISSPILVESNRYPKDDGDFENISSLQVPPSSSSSNTNYHNNASIEPQSTPKGNISNITSPYQQGTSSFQTPPIPEGSKVSHSRQGSQHLDTKSFTGNTSYQSQRNDVYSIHQRSFSGTTQTHRPPEPFNSHQRSISDANAVDTTDFELRQSELELRSIRVEIRDLKKAKHGIVKEITELSTTRDNLSKTVEELTLKLQSLKHEISENETQNVTNTEAQKIQPIAHSPSVRNLSNIEPSLEKQVNTSIASEQSQDSQDPRQQQQQQQQKSRAKFWKRGPFFKQDPGSSNISGSQSAYSLSNILNTGGSNNTPGNLQISAPLLRTEELDELGGNDNKKLAINNGKYLDAGSVSSSTSSSNNNNNNGSSSALIMSDLFNSTLESRAIYEKRPIPLIISRLIKEVEKRGLNSEGLYRKNGATSQMNLILKCFNALLTKDTSQDLENSLDDVDINAVTSSLKRYLYYHLPEPLITNNVYDGFIRVSTLSDPEEKKQELRKILNTLPKTNLKVLKVLLNHLNLVEKHKDSNKMNHHNLAVVFGPTLLRVADSEKELKDMQARNTVMEFLMVNSGSILELD